jgi:hypothetical protein
MVELNQEKVITARVSVLFDLEDDVIKSISNRNLPLEERASLANGLILGFLDNREWQSAIKYVYENNVISALVDIKREDFVRMAIDSAKQKRRTEGLYDKSLDLLLENWKPQELCELVTQAPIFMRDSIKIADIIADKIPEEQMQKMYASFGEKMLGKWDEDFYDREENAYGAFKRAKNFAKIDELYNKIISKTKLYDSNFELLLKITKEDTDVAKRNKRVLQLTQKLLTNKELHKSYLVDEFYKFSKENKILEEDPNSDKLIKLVAIHEGSYDFREESEKAKSYLGLCWAKAHVKDYPALAYSILKQQNYKGPEVLVAAQSGLLHNHRDNEDAALRIEAVDKKDLETLVSDPKTPVQIRVKIAEFFDDKKSMLELSKELYQKTKDANTAYELWFKGGGSDDDEIFKKCAMCSLKGKRPISIFLVLAGWPTKTMLAKD